MNLPCWRFIDCIKKQKSPKLTVTWGVVWVNRMMFNSIALIFILVAKPLLESNAMQE